MRMLRHVVTALLLAVLGCSRPAPEPQIGDAGHVASAPRPPARPDAGSAPMATQRAPVVVPRPRRHRPDPSAADDRVLACTRNASDKASLMGCLGSFEAPAVDAGVVPKFASLAPVPPSKTSWLVPLWYVSATSGNDNNTCVTSGAPCKTFAEIVRRWQTDSPFISGGVTVQILSDLPQSDTIAWTPQYSDSAGNAFISGTATVIATGTLASVVANDHSTQALQADLGSTGRVGLEICDSTHPSCAQVALSVSGTTYTLTQPILNFAEVNTWANGDSFTIYQLPKAYFAHTANITVDSVWKFDGGAFGFYAESTEFTNGRVDDSAEIVATQFPGFVNEYSHGQGSLILSDGEILGGFSTGPILSSIFSGGLIGLDAIIATEANLSGTGGTTIQGAYSTSGTLWHLAGMEIVVGFGSPGTGPMYGPSYQVDVARGRVIYAVDPGGTSPATAAASFLGGATLTIVGAAFGKACDLAHTPLQCLPDVALSPAQLDTSFVGGGFGGIATSGDGLAGFAGFNNVGTWPSVSNLCPTAGTFMTGRPSLPCDTPTGTGAVSSVTGTSGVSCSPTTGAVVCSATGAFSAGNDLSGTPTSQNVIAISGTSGVVEMRGSSISYDETVSAPILTQTQRSTDATTHTFLVAAQSAESGASTNQVGGTLELVGGAGSTATGAGTILLPGGNSGAAAGDVDIIAASGTGGLGVIGFVASAIRSSTGEPWAWGNASQSLTGAGGTTITLSSTQYQNPVIRLSGTAGAGTNTTVAFPDAPGFWLVDFSNVTFGAGAGIILSSGTAITGTIVTANVALNKSIGTLLTFGGASLSFEL